MYFVVRVHQRKESQWLDTRAALCTCTFTPVFHTCSSLCVWVVLGGLSTYFKEGTWPQIGPGGCCEPCGDQEKSRALSFTGSHLRSYYHHHRRDSLVLYWRLLLLGCRPRWKCPNTWFPSFRAQGSCGIAQGMFLDLLAIPRHRVTLYPAGKREIGMQSQRSTVWHERSCPFSKTVPFSPFHPLM